MQLLKNTLKKMSILLPDRLFLKIKYRYTIGEKLNLDNPKAYNEKLQWLKLYDRKIEEKQYVDKLAVRSYIREKIGEEYLTPLIAVFNSVEEIDWDKLPNKFVLKCTHGSGSNIICDNKSELNILEAENKLKRWMDNNWFWYGREWSYKNLEPKIICEQYLEDNITDYKFMCFHGEPKLIQIHQDRHDEAHTIDFYDTNWKKTSISRRNTPNSNTKVKRPEKLEEMLELSRQLSENELHVRVDFYEVNRKIFFGEKTYYSASGFSPFKEKQDDYLIGSWLDLPIKT